jgi:hypothetical protein
VKVTRTGGVFRGPMPTLTPEDLAGVRTIRCRHCGYRVFSEDDGRSIYLVCSGCARMLAEVVAPKEALKRGRLSPVRRAA